MALVLVVVALVLILVVFARASLPWIAVVTVALMVAAAGPGGPRWASAARTRPCQPSRRPARAGRS